MLLLVAKSVGCLAFVAADLGGGRGRNRGGEGKRGGTEKEHWGARERERDRLEVKKSEEKQE